MERFMTFNLKYDFDSEGNNLWAARVKRIVKVIKDNEPLCIGTQEGLIHMLNDMQSNLEEYHWIGEGREENDEYNAIFYKKELLKLLEWDQFWLSETPSVKFSTSWGAGCKRICTWARFKKVDDDKEFILYNTHLDNLSELAREEGIKVILDFAKSMYDINKVPFIVMGDFNCYIEDDVFKIVNSYNCENLKLKNIYNECEHNIEGTFHNFEGGYEGGIIDYIITSGEYNCSNVYIDDRMITGGFPSDHYPVIAELSME